MSASLQMLGESCWKIVMKHLHVLACLVALTEATRGMSFIFCYNCWKDLTGTLKSPLVHAGRQGVSAEARWPELRIRTLVLHGTRVTTACLQNLAALAELQYLDMRCSLLYILQLGKKACEEDAFTGI